MDGAADEDRLGRVPISAATRRPTAMPSTIFLAFASIGLAGNEQKKKGKEKKNQVDGKHLEPLPRRLHWSFIRYFAGFNWVVPGFEWGLLG